MKLVVETDPRHQQAFEGVPEAVIEEALGYRLEDAATQVSLRFVDETATPEQRAAYQHAVWKYGVLAAAKHDYAVPEDREQLPRPGWVRTARQGLQEFAERFPGARNVLATSFFSEDVNVLADLNRAVYAFVEERGMRSLNTRQFAAALAIDEVVWVGEPSP